MTGRNTKRLLYICADDGIPVWGDIGGSSHIREVALGLERLGYAVTVVAATVTPGENPEINLPTYQIPPGESDINGAEKHLRRELRENARLQRNENAKQLLLELHEKTPFDAVYERYSLFSYAGLEFAQRIGVPFVLEVNSPLIEETLKHRTLALAPAAEAIRQRLFSEAGHIVAVSSAVARHVLAVSPMTPVSVLPNAVNAERYRELPDASIRRVKLGIDPDSFVVGYLGSFKPWHGLPTLIEAFAGLKKENQKAKLLVVGDGKKLRPDLEGHCAHLGLDGSALFTGEVSYRDIPEYLAACDALVAPYPNIPNFYFSPLKLFEYMASGKPIVASALGQIQELLQHEHTALLISPNDTAALTSALTRLAKDGHLAERLGRRARDLALTKHTWDQRANAIHSLIQHTPVAIKSEAV